MKFEFLDINMYAIKLGRKVLDLKTSLLFYIGPVAYHSFTKHDK